MFLWKQSKTFMCFWAIQGICVVGINNHIHLWIFYDGLTWTCFNLLLCGMAELIDFLGLLVTTNVPYVGEVFLSEGKWECHVSFQFKMS